MMVNTMNAPLPLALAYDAQRDETFVWVLRIFFLDYFRNPFFQDINIRIRRRASKRS